MKKITIEVPDGKKAIQSEKDGVITIMFSNQPKSWNEIETFEDACEKLGINPQDSSFTVSQPDEIAYRKLKIIISVINEGWVPDWNNSRERKWYPWFNLSSGFGFAVSYYNSTGTYTIACSRLCFSSEEKSNYVGKQFIDLYETFLTIK